MRPTVDEGGVDVVITVIKGVMDCIGDLPIVSSELAIDLTKGPITLLRSESQVPNPIDGMLSTSAPAMGSPGRSAPASPRMDFMMMEQRSYSDGSVVGGLRWNMRTSFTENVEDGSRLYGEGSSR